MRWVALSVGVILVAVVAVVGAMSPASQYAAQSPLLGHRAPMVKGTTITAQRFDLDAQRGRWLVIDFFSSWCVPCHTEEPELVKFAKEHLGGTQLVGIVFQDSTSGIRTLLGRWVGLYPVLIDPGGQFALNYGVDNPPSKYVISPHGEVAAKIVGPVTAAGLDATIAHAKAQGL